MPDTNSHLWYSYNSDDSTITIYGDLGVYNCGAKIIYTAIIDSNQIVLTNNVIDTLMLTCMCYFKITMHIDSFCYQNFTVMYQGNYILQIINKQEDIENIIITPNPSNNFIEINCKDIFNENKILIYDIDGKIQKRITIKNKNELVDISDLKQGIFFVKLENTNKIIKLIKE